VPDQGQKFTPLLLSHYSLLKTKGKLKKEGGPWVIKTNVLPIAE